MEYETTGWELASSGGTYSKKKHVRMLCVCFAESSSSFQQPTPIIGKSISLMNGLDHRGIHVYTLRKWMSCLGGGL